MLHHRFQLASVCRGMALLNVDLVDYRTDHKCMQISGCDKHSMTALSFITTHSISLSQPVR